MTASASIEARSFITSAIGSGARVSRMPETTVAAMVAVIVRAFMADPGTARLVICGQGAAVPAVLPTDGNILVLTPDSARLSESVIVLDPDHALAEIGAALLVSPSLLIGLAWWRASGDGEAGPVAPALETTVAADADGIRTITGLLRAAAGDDDRIVAELDALDAATRTAAPDARRMTLLLQDMTEHIGGIEAANQARLEAVGHVATWIAHTVNNALTPILLAAEMGMTERDLDAIADLLAIISESARRGGRVTHQLLAASPPSSGEASTSSLAAAARSALAAAREDWPENIALLEQIPDESLPVPLSPLQAEFILGSLIQAARMVARAGNAVPVVARRGAGDTVEVEVSCTGSRLAVADFATRLRAGAAGPFTEAEGLGLALTRLIVESLGGTTAMSTDPETGTVFRLSLPLIEP